MSHLASLAPRHDFPLLAAQPTNQYLVALQATTWRLLGDSRYEALCDYERLVGTRTLDPPAGWHSLPAFLADVVAELESLHRFVAHPFQQSHRNVDRFLLSFSQGSPPCAKFVGAEQWQSYIAVNADYFK